MFKRHDLIYLNSEGRKEAADFSVRQYPFLDSRLISELISDPCIPAVISRQDGAEEGYVQIGFAHYKIENSSRFRVPSMVSQKHIIRKISPYEVFSKALSDEFSKFDILKQIGNGAARYGIDIGLYGSTALECITGYPYMTSKSDIDIFIRKRDNTSDTFKFYEFLKILEKSASLKIDCEVEIFNDYGVKLQEIFSEQKTVLGKGFREVRLFYKEELTEFIREINEYESRS